MSTHVATTTSAWSQTGDNRKRKDVVIEIADYSGGGNRPVVQLRAQQAWDSAVKEYNAVLWKFNRVVADITLANNTQDYDLATNFAEPLRAVLLDSDGIERVPVFWVKYEEWLHFVADNKGTSGAPEHYSARNTHANGKVSVYPRVASPITYPTMRLHHFRRIALAADGEATLDVPMEVDEGIFQLAVAKHMMKEKGPKGAIEHYTLAGATRMRLEQQWRDWPDF